MILLSAILALTACDSTTPAVARWNRAKVDAGGMTFGVHWSDISAEAYRTSRHLRPRLSAVRANAVVAIEQASGCKVREGSVAGDQAIVTADLVCAAARAAKG